MVIFPHQRWRTRFATHYDVLEGKSQSCGSALYLQQLGSRGIKPDPIEGLTATWDTLPIGSTYGIYANIGGILMVNVTIYSIHGSYGLGFFTGLTISFRIRRNSHVKSPGWNPDQPLETISQDEELSFPLQHTMAKPYAVILEGFQTTMFAYFWGRIFYGSVLGLHHTPSATQ